MIHPVLKDKLPQVIRLLEEHKVQRAYAFGSVVTGKFKEGSDIDLLVTFEEEPNPLISGERWWDLYFSLQNLLKRNVDLLTEEQLHNPYLIESINETKSLIYGKGS